MLTDGNTCLSDDDIHNLCCLRMDREFMEFMRERFSKESGQKLNLSVLSAEDNHVALTGEDDSDRLTAKARRARRSMQHPT